MITEYCTTLYYAKKLGAAIKSFDGYNLSSVNATTFSLDDCGEVATALERSAVNVHCCNKRPSAKLALIYRHTSLFGTVYVEVFTPRIL